MTRHRPQRMRLDDMTDHDIEHYLAHELAHIGCTCQPSWRRNGHRLEVEHEDTCRLCENP